MQPALYLIHTANHSDPNHNHNSRLLLNSTQQ